MNYLGPGLDMTDHIIDKHFDKIPAKVFDKDTYKPGRRRSRRNSEQQQDQNQNQNQNQNQQVDQRRNSQSQQDSSDSGSESEQEEQQQSRERDREPRRRRREKGGRSMRQLEDNPIPEVEEYSDIEENKKKDNRLADIPRYSGQGQQQPSAYTYMAGSSGRQYTPIPLYSNEPPRYRPQYIPSGQAYSPDRGRYDSDDDGYAKPARSRRPKAVTRRSSSYHGPRDRRDYNNSYGFRDGNDDRERRRGSEVGTMEKAKNEAENAKDKAESAGKRYGVKEEIEDVISTSTAGLAGSAVGAVVGGWAANKAQVAYGKDKKRSESNPLLTLLGAAAGGLVVDVLVARIEEQRKEAKEKERKWEKKFGDEDGERRRDGRDSRDSRDSRRGSESGGRRRQQRRGSYSD